MLNANLIRVNYNHETIIKFPFLINKHSTINNEISETILTQYLN